jgi:cytochrome b
MGYGNTRISLAVGGAYRLCFLTGEDDGLTFAIHAYTGFVVLLLLVFRLGWGFVGSRHSRFSDFIYPWSTVRRYSVSLLKFRPDRFVGHNPLGGLMVFLMLGVLLVSALSGFLMVSNNFGWLEDFHEALGELMQILVLIHIAGVLVDQLLTRENLVWAMVSGHKPLPEDTAKNEASSAGHWKALVLAVAVVAGGTYLFQQTAYSTKVATVVGKEDDGRKNGKDDD